MADSVQNIDDLIVCLVGMGFELEDCQEAVQAGKLAVQAAVEWILAGKPKETTSGAQGNVLRLTGQSSSATVGSNPFSTPPPGPPQPSLPGTQAPPGTEDPPDTVVSRSHLSDEQRRFRQRCEEKERAETRKKMQEDKLATKRAREQALRQIQEDRERQKMRKHAGDTGTGGAATGTALGGPAATEKVQTADKKCVIQVRLPCGRILKQSFPPEARLQEVWALVERNVPDSGGMCLMQPFPRKEFSAADLSETLAGHGLVPSGSLVLKKLDKPPQGAPMDTTGSPTDQSESSGQLSSDSAKSNPTSSPPSLPSPSQSPHNLPGSLGGAIGGGPPLAGGVGGAIGGGPPLAGGVGGAIGGGPPLAGGVGGAMGAGLPLAGALGDVFGGGPPMAGAVPQSLSHQWGSGHRLEFGEEVEMENVPMEEVEGADEEVEADMDVAGGGPGFPIPGGGLPLPPGMNVGPGWNHPQNNQAFAGAGNVLSARWPGENEDRPHHKQDPKQLAAQAANQRFARPPSPPPAPSAPAPAPHTPIPRLTQLIVGHVSGRICDTRAPITSLQGLPAEVAGHILQHLVRERLLRTKTLTPFINCHLNKLVLDSYPYVTNELLLGIRLHCSLIHLSLASCPLITDKGLLALNSLKRLKYLSLLGCKQLTDRCFVLLKDLPSLITLVLEDTGVTDAGVHDYSSAAPPALQNLDLNRTAVTSSVLGSLRHIPRLRCLSLEGTPLTSLSGVEAVTSLETLNVARTRLVPEALLCLRGHPGLARLNVGDTDIDGDKALRYLTGLSLQVLQLPSRLTTTAAGIQCLAGMPLIELDLTNYINIRPEGFEHISGIHTLKRLRLSNTKITDAGMVFLTGLRLLEELSLDRTVITDEGAAVVNGNNFPQLQELSMFGTGVTDAFLTSGHLNSCTALSKLNLSHTAVTDEGVKSLRLSYLTLLNLDHTSLSEGLTTELQGPSPCLVLTGCPRLARVCCVHCGPRDEV